PGDHASGSQAHGRRRWRTWAPVALVALATATRFETAGVAVALAAGLVAVGVQGWHDPAAPPPPLPQRLRGAAAVASAAAGTIAVFGSIGLAFGQEVLPNSVLIKTIGDRGDARRTVAAALDRLVSDPLLVVFVLIAVAVLATTRRMRWREPARPTGAVFPA